MERLTMRRLALILTALCGTMACGGNDFGDAFGSGQYGATEGEDGSTGGDGDSGSTGGQGSTAGSDGSDGSDGSTGAIGSTGDGGDGDGSTGGTEPPDDCGNGTVDLGEECDGYNFGQYSSDIVCLFEGYTGGNASCTDDCQLDLSTCDSGPGSGSGGGGECGNDEVDPGEECDGGVGSETCQSQGFDEGSLSCDNYCMLETSACQTCGDGMIGGSERCDCGTDGAPCTEVQLGRTACTDLTAPSGEKYTGGTLGCVPTCDAFDESGCTE